MVVAFVAVIAPWSIRNTRLQKTFVAIDDMGGRNLMMGNYAYTPLYRAWDAISEKGERAWDQVLRAEQPEASGATQGQIDKLALRSGLQFMAAHPALTLQRCFVKFIDFWQQERDLIGDAKHGDFGEISSAALLAFALVITGAYAAVMFTGIFGIVFIPPINWRIHGLFLLLIAYVCAMHTLTFGHSRYHIPLLPIVLLYSAAALVQFQNLWRQRWTWKFALASSVCGLLAASWAWELLWVDPNRYFNMLR
jgi:hypothetical protein